MHFRRLLACLGLAAGWLAPIRAEERNAWPVRVVQNDEAGNVTSTNWAGPLFFSKPQPDGARSAGFRPFYLERIDATGLRTDATALYPLFTYRADRESYRWSVFNLINRTGRHAGSSPKLVASNHERFDIWPFYFSRNTGDPATSYRALVPIGGTVKSFVGYDRISWILLPLYAQVETNGTTTTHTPWPFVRTTRGAEHGFAIWPLFGWREKPDVFERRYLLWPLMWNNTIQPRPDAPAHTPVTRQVGVLPFYTRETRPGYIDQNYVWPFFGSTHRTVPNRYDETRYLWPFFVQGRGDDRNINRWGPFYTHSTVKGFDKTWIAWPLWQHTEWNEVGVVQKRNALLFRVYWSLEQRSLTNPNAAPARKIHVWPLFSGWDNGAGRRQRQFPSPIEPFFPHNEYMRATWSPLFALYRYDQRAPGDERTSILWDAVTWSRSQPEQRSEFHLGPLFSVETHAEEKRVALGNGLVGFRHGAGRGWHVFWLDFPSKRAHSSTATTR